MKLFVAHPDRIRLPARQSQGMTLVEVLISTSLMMTCVIGGLLAANMMGLRYERLLESKAGASDSARRNITQLKNDIYGAKGWQIGSWDGSTFTPVALGANQQAPALIIYPLIVNSNQIVDLSQFTLYYFDSSDIANNNGCLWYKNTISGDNRIIVSNLIAPLFFTAESFDGSTQTVRQFKAVIHSTFQYSQFQYPLTQVNSNTIFNSYRMDVRATPHLPDGI
jgi:hypothetical protein